MAKGFKINDLENHLLREISLTPPTERFVDEDGEDSWREIEDPPRFAIIHITVYILGYEYGGPEEGGWWYDTGEIVKTWPVRVIRAEGSSEYTLPDSEKELIADIEGELQEFTFGTHYRTSMRPQGSDYRLIFGWIEEPRPFPERKPYYC